MHKDATFVGTIRWGNGNVVSFHTGINSNTGETIVWQTFNGRTQRLTGRNITKLMDELEQALNEGECRWTALNDAALEALTEGAL